MLHIGIVASSAEGAALCYRTICVEGAELLGPYNHPEVSMHGHPFIQYKNCIDTNDWAGVAELMLSSAEKLARAGADFLIAPVNLKRKIDEAIADGRMPQEFRGEAGSHLRKGMIRDLVEAGQRVYPCAASNYCWFRPESRFARRAITRS